MNRNSAPGPDGRKKIISACSPLAEHLHFETHIVNINPKSTWGCLSTPSRSLSERKRGCILPTNHILNTDQCNDTKLNVLRGIRNKYGYTFARTRSFELFVICVDRLWLAMNTYLTRLILVVKKGNARFHFTSFSYWQDFISKFDVIFFDNEPNWGCLNYFKSKNKVGMYHDNSS